jgi:hypothetical protein
MLPKSSQECRAKALVEEEMAALVSYRPDRDRCLGEAKRWRELERLALLREANSSN